MAREAELVKANGMARYAAAESLERNLPRILVEMILSRVMFRNMSSEEVLTGSEPVSEPAAAAAAEPGIETAPKRVELDLTDPKAMRALAHPVRMALLELIEVAGTLTATQASELLGESPANCAFHLRTLGKYGFIAETGGGKGRERPWKIVNPRIRLSTQQESPSAALVARTLQQQWLDRVLRRAREILGSAERPEGWRDAEVAIQTVRFITRDELTQLTEDVRQVLDRYEERQGNPSERPEGALPVEFLYFAYPLAHLADIAADAKPEDEA
jgi:predicted transcriptional regulator